jgi:hypothetical protein
MLAIGTLLNNPLKAFKTEDRRNTRRYPLGFLRLSWSVFLIRPYLSGMILPKSEGIIYMRIIRVWSLTEKSMK